MVESYVDVLIHGAGPAGRARFHSFFRVKLIATVMMAAWMARFNLKTRIVDKRSGKIVAGCVYDLGRRG